jgi:hypothetical protein
VKKLKEREQRKQKKKDAGGGASIGVASGLLPEKRLAAYGL